MADSLLETTLKKYYQKKIELWVGEQLIKSGKFLLYKNYIDQSKYFFELHLQRKGKIETVKIPYPYEIEEYEDENLLYLDYRNKTLVKNCPVLINMIEQFSDSQVDEKSIFFNKILEVKFESDEN